VRVANRERHTPLSPELARDLRAARQAAGISLRRLERFMALSRGYLSLLERGLRCPSIATVEKLGKLRYVDRALYSRLLKAAAPATSPRRKE
jgi:transcriptional regulator with XRE-family HTH domain